MKQRLTLVAGAVALILGVLILSSRDGPLSRKLTISWTYDYSKQPPCGERRVRDCIEDFEILDYTHPEKPAFLQTVPNPKGAKGMANHISCVISYGPPFGTRTIVVVAVAVDKDGVRRTSNPYAARKNVKILPRALSHSKEP